jgi:3-hydroxyisobutyrate dehydrogenase
MLRIMQLCRGPPLVPCSSFSVLSQKVLDEPEKQKDEKMNIALIGTGLMGRAMAERLLAEDYQLTVFNRTREKAEGLRSSGAEIAESAAEAVASAPCSILMLSDAMAIREVIFDGSPRPELNQRTVIQMGTISPSESLYLQGKVAERGGEYLEAPVLGSIPEASSGKLLVMVGAAASQFAKWSGLLRCFGPDPLKIGEVGRASALKLAMNQLIASLTTGFSLSLGFVARSGIDVDLFMKIVRQSSLYAPTFDKKLERMLRRDYTNPNFPCKHLVKDTELFRNEALDVNLEVSVLESVCRLLDLTVEQGFGDSDYSALYNTINPTED